MNRFRLLFPLLVAVLFANSAHAQFVESRRHVSFLISDPTSGYFGRTWGAGLGLDMGVMVHHSRRTTNEVVVYYHHFFHDAGTPGTAHGAGALAIHGLRLPLFELISVHGGLGAGGYWYDKETRNPPVQLLARTSDGPRRVVPDTDFGGFGPRVLLEARLRVHQSPQRTIKLGIASTRTWAADTHLDTVQMYLRIGMHGIVAVGP